jgi:AcrR family transcriptional regulator
MKVNEFHVHKPIYRIWVPVFNIDNYIKRYTMYMNERSFIITSDRLSHSIMQKTLPSHSENSRQAILQAAYDLFLEKGYSATSMRQIARHAGLALGGIYNHFPGKESIYSTLFIERHPFHQVLPVLLNMPDIDIEQFVRKSAQAMISELGKRSDFIKLMLIEIVEFNGRNMPLIQGEVLGKVLPLVERFNLRNRLRPIPPFVFFRAFLGLFFSYYMTELLLVNLPGEFRDENTLDNFVEIFLHGILNDEEPV